MIEHGKNTGRFIDPCPILEVKEIPARKVDEGCQLKTSHKYKKEVKKCRM
jgi:hypothetical protein